MTSLHRRLRAVAGSPVALLLLTAATFRPSAFAADQGGTWTGAMLGPRDVAMSASDIGPEGGGAPIVRMVEWRPVRAGGTRITLPALSRVICGADATPASCFPEIPAGGLERAPSPPFHATGYGPPLAGRHPLVLAVGSSASRGGEFVALAEALSSHGMIVAEVIPPAGDPGGFDAAALARSRARLDRVRALMSARSDVDPDRTAIVAWSFGGVPAALAGCRAARAVVSLDSALRYRYGADLLRAARFDASPCTADLLSIAAGIGNSVPTDEGFVDAWPIDHRQRRTAAGVAHGDFSDRHGALPAATGPADAAAAFARRYGAVLDDVVAFLAARLRPGLTGAAAAR